MAIAPIYGGSVAFAVVWSRASRHQQQRCFRCLLRHITRIAVRMDNWLLIDAIVAGIDRRKSANGCAAIKHGQHVIPQTEHEAGPGRSRTRGYVAIVGPITRYFTKEPRRTPHKRVGHITGVMWCTTDSGHIKRLGQDDVRSVLRSDTRRTHLCRFASRRKARRSHRQPQTRRCPLRASVGQPTQVRIIA
jgi:hypothetical protein